jgi:hypothetical protein
MKKILYILCVIFCLTTSLLSQVCHKASWVKPYAGTSANDVVWDAGRDAAQNFVILGSYGTTALTLNGNTMAVGGLYHFYLAKHDSGGIFSNAKRIGYYTATGNELTINKMTVGADGSVYVVGQYKGSNVYFNDSLLPATTVRHMFAAKFDAALQLKWKVQSDWMHADCYGNDITCDLNKNVYVAGSFTDNAFKIGNFVVDNSGGYNLWSGESYFMKLDSLGHAQFVKSFGAYGSDAARTITADNLGDVIITGATSSSYIQFDNQHMVQAGTTNGNLYFGKFSGTDGHCIWGKMAGGFNPIDVISPYDAALGDNNSLYICGQITGLINFPPHTYTSLDANGFITKIDANGNNVWLQTIGGQNSSENAVSVAYYNNEVAVCGSLFSNHPYIGNYPMYSTLTGGSFSAFNAQLFSDGSLKFARANNNTSSNLYNKCVAIDNAGNQLLWGGFKGTQNWYPLSLTNSSSNTKLFLAKFVGFTASPSFTVNAGIDKSTSCSTSVQISASTNPTNIAFGWYPDLGFSANGTKTPNVNPGINKTYILYGTYQGCVKSDTMKVSVSNNSLTVSAGADLSFCRGDSAQIMATSNQAGTTFSWTPNSFLNTATSQTPYAKPASTTNYILTGTNAGCKSYDTVRITHHPKPVIYLPKQNLSTYWYTHLCSGTPLAVNMGDSTNLYTVLTPTVVSNINNNHITIPGTAGGWLKVKAQSAEGCTNRDSIIVAIHANQAPPPVQGTVSNRSACPGDSVKFGTAFTNSLNYTFQYGWYAVWQIDSLNGKGWQDVSIYDNNYYIFNYSQGFSTSTYYTYITVNNVKPDMNGFKFRFYVHDYCSPNNYSNEAVLTVGPKITVQPLNKNLCVNATDSINVNSSSANTSYQWEIKQGASFVPIVNQPGVMTTNGRYLKFINVQPAINGSILRCRVNGCTPQAYEYSDTALIKVIAPPVILSQSNNDTLCELINDTLKVNVSAGPYTFQWYANGSPLGCTSQICGANTSQLRFTPVYMNQNNFTYTCKISSAQCNYTLMSTPINFSVTALPTLTWTATNMTSCLSSGPVSLTGALPAGGMYSGPGVTGNMFDPASVGTGTFVISYSYTNAGGCSAVKNRNMIVSLCTGVEETEKGKLLVKQSDDAIYIEHTGYFSQRFSAVLYNSNGQKISTSEFTGNCTHCKIETSSLSPGFYMLQLQDGEKSKTFKVIIQ